MWDYWLWFFFMGSGVWGGNCYRRGCARMCESFCNVMIRFYCILVSEVMDTAIRESRVRNYLVLCYTLCSVYDTGPTV